MREEYDFSDGVKNPSVKEPVIFIDESITPEEFENEGVDGDEEEQ